MKKILLATIAVALGVSAQAITVKGTMKGFTNDTVTLQLCPISKVGTDSQRESLKKEVAVAQGGTFEINVAATEPMVGNIVFDQYKIKMADPTRGAYYEADKMIELLMAADETVTFEATNENGAMTYSLEGTELNKQITEVGVAMQPAKSIRNKALVDILGGKIGRDEYYKQYELSMAKENELFKSIFPAYSGKAVAEYMVTTYSSPDSIEYYANQIGSSAKGSLAATLLDMRVKQVKHDAEVNSIRKANEGKDNEGQVATDFTLPDMSGKAFTLSTLRGKFVILDFWGSWCVWCIKGMPALKEFYAKHKADLEVVGVACNDGQSQWRAAVKRHELPWINVYNSSDGPADRNVAALYAITGYPTKYLIDPEGKIVVKIVGEDPEFFNKVEAAITAYKK